MPDLLAPFYNAFTNLGKKNYTSLQPGASSIFLYLGFLNSFATGVFFFLTLRLMLICYTCLVQVLLPPSNFVHSSPVH